MSAEMDAEANLEHAEDKTSAGRRRSSLVTGNVRVAGRRTSVRLEPQMWAALNQIRIREGITLPQLITQIQAGGLASSLTAAIRVYLLLYFMSAATEEGHVEAGHGNAQRRLVLLNQGRDQARA